MPPERRLVLVGAGHAHLHLLRNADRLASVGYRVTLVAPRRFDYSGTASAIAAGDRDPDTGTIDVEALARWHSVEHLVGTVVAANPRTRSLTTDDGRVLGYDVVSFNVGSVAATPRQVEGDPDGGVVVAVKPLTDLARLRSLLHEPRSGRGHQVTIIGAGASGIELASQLSARSDIDGVTLLEAGPAFAEFLPPRAARRLRRLIARRGAAIVTGVAVEEITQTEVRLRGGAQIPHDVVVLATGLVAPALATTSPLGGPDGFPVRSTLQHRDHDDVYAAGDCADFLPGRLPKIGVHGVRQGPVLLEALESRASGGAPPVYRPQRDALSILDLGGTALAVRGRWWWLGGSSLLLKRVIDGRWLTRHQS